VSPDEAIDQPNCSLLAAMGLARLAVLAHDDPFHVHTFASPADTSRPLARPGAPATTMPWKTVTDRPSMSPSTSAVAGTSATGSDHTPPDLRDANTSPLMAPPMYEDPMAITSPCTATE
jgi:hypothetical protein